MGGVASRKTDKQMVQEARGKGGGGEGIEGALNEWHAQMSVHCPFMLLMSTEFCCVMHHCALQSFNLGRTNLFILLLQLLSM